MFQRRSKYNLKRRIQPPPQTDLERKRLQTWARTARYDGNPEHKKNPGDFQLSPPAKWNPDKELCDRVNIHAKSEATRLLRAGFTKGLISEQMRGEWPQNVWSMTDANEPLEAQLGNHEEGIYHGYPMSDDAPFREFVIARWEAR